MTFSLLGADPETGAVGVAVQSKFPGVGSITAHARAGAGAMTTQAFANPAHGPRGLELLALGAAPTQMVEILLRDDAKRDERQIAAMTPTGAAAHATGAAVRGWKGVAGASEGAHALAIGNSLSNDGVTQAMVAGFEAAPGDLSDRLLAGLRAGQAAGGELRGQQAARLLVVKAGGGYGGQGDGAGAAHVDISVYDHPEPIEELARCLKLHRLSYFPSDPADLLPIDAALARELKDRLVADAFLSAADAVGADWDAAAIAAMARFMGHENYDNRIRQDAMIDRAVLADIRAKRR